MASNNFFLNLKPTKVISLLAIIWIVLIVSNIAVYSVYFKTDDGYIYGLFPTFDLDDEGNLPSFFSAILLLSSSLLLAVIAKCSKIEKRPYALHWKILSMIFLFLALDEAALFHEVLGDFFSTWVIPVIPLILLFILAYRKFFLHLPRKEKSFFILAFCFYIWGGIGFEILGLPLDIDSLGYLITLTCEEALEMLASIVFIYILLDYIAKNFKGLKINFQAEK